MGWGDVACQRDLLSSARPVPTYMTKKGDYLSLLSTTLIERDRGNNNNDNKKNERKKIR